MSDPPPMSDDPSMATARQKELSVIEEQRQRAIRRIRAKRGFWVHASIYLAVIAFLFLIWAMTSATYPWPLWPMLGWGIGVIAHGASVYIRPAEITEEQIQRELQGRSGS